MEAHVICLASKWATRGKAACAHYRRCSEIQKVHRFDAVTPADFDAEEVAHPYALATIKGGRARAEQTQLSRIVQMACYMSHLRLWERCIGTKDGIVIAEDDGYPRHLRRRICDARTAPLDADVVLIQCSKWPFTAKRCSEDLGGTLCKRVSWFWGTACYYLTPRGAAKLRKHALPITHHVDAYMATCIHGIDLKVYSVPGANDQKHDDSTLAHDGLWSVLLIRQWILLAVVCIAALIVIVGLSCGLAHSHRRFFRVTGLPAGAFR